MWRSHLRRLHSPRDQIRPLSQLAQYQVSPIAGSSPDWRRHLDRRNRYRRPLPTCRSNLNISAGYSRLSALQHR
jgi:hypothetical protein